ncbi:glutamate synthase conserved region-containing protein [Nonomuraea solani]|uniref:Glutamate synthase conserved region-containing protein n=1 Tax=Nonomuraea solani TaxID=1144553 RepID=A0A1H6DWV5_9ACTN|nr:glutamate synthase-related protein [Nonomuraea solani]SEG89203.1 glutamate synthase conserved region-containing protein [Nonomuraea solani]
MTGLVAHGFAEQPVRLRARHGVAALFPDARGYGSALFGARSGPQDATDGDPLEAARLVPPVFMPNRLEKLIELGREPTYRDVDLSTVIGALRSPLPVYVSAFGSTRAAGDELGVAVSRQAAALGLPMVIGENVVPVNGLGRDGGPAGRSLLARLRAYSAEADDTSGGVVVQQSTEDADAEVWQLVYGDPSTQRLLASGRLAFELKLGQGAKPGLGGMTLVDRTSARRLADRYDLEELLDPGSGSASVLRCGTPGTFTAEILAQQIRFMRNNFPRVRIWVKLHPGRDVAEAATVARTAGADAVTVDGAEGGTGWAPSAFLGHVGLPLHECLRRLGRGRPGLLVSGRMWEGTRAVKCLALGATAVGLGRAAMLAADEDPRAGLIRLVRCLALEMRMLISALGQYAPAALSPHDVWNPAGSAADHTPELQGVAP